MSGIRITPFGTVPKVSNLIIDGDLNLGANKLLTNVIQESSAGAKVTISAIKTNQIDEETEAHGVIVDSVTLKDGSLSGTYGIATSHALSPSASNVLYTNSTSYPLAENGSGAEADLFSITVPAGYAPGAVSPMVAATIHLKVTTGNTRKVSGYIKVYVNSTLKLTLLHSAYLDNDTPSGSTMTKTGVLTGLSSGDVVLVRGYAQCDFPLESECALSKFEIKGNNGAFVGSDAPTW